MGFLDKVLKAVRKPSDPPRPLPKVRVPEETTTPVELRGPDPTTLLTASDIELVTGSLPDGEPDRRSGGIDVDTGFMRACIWPLQDGGELLLNFTRFATEEHIALWRTRWDDPGWANDENEKPLDGVGEIGRWHVGKAARGGTELHVTAKLGMYESQLVHTSPSGSRDIAPLSALLATVLGRLNDG